MTEKPVIEADIAARDVKPPEPTVPDQLPPPPPPPATAPKKYITPLWMEIIAVVATMTVVIRMVHQYLYTNEEVEFLYFVVWLFLCARYTWSMGSAIMSHIRNCNHSLSRLIGSYDIAPWTDPESKARRTFSLIVSTPVVAFVLLGITGTNTYVGPLIVGISAIIHFIVRLYEIHGMPDLSTSLSSMKEFVKQTKNNVIRTLQKVLDCMPLSDKPIDNEHVYIFIDFSKDNDYAGFAFNGGVSLHDWNTGVVNRYRAILKGIMANCTDEVLRYKLYIHGYGKLPGNGVETDTVFPLLTPHDNTFLTDQSQDPKEVILNAYNRFAQRPRVFTHMHWTAIGNHVKANNLIKKSMFFVIYCATTDTPVDNTGLVNLDNPNANITTICVNEKQWLYPANRQQKIVQVNFDYSKANWQDDLVKKMNSAIKQHSDPVVEEKTPTLPTGDGALFH